MADFGQNGDLWLSQNVQEIPLSRQVEATSGPRSIKGGVSALSFFDSPETLGGELTGFKTGRFWWPAASFGSAL